MDNAERSQFCEDVDAFLLAKKFLSGPQPPWEPGSRPNQLDARWPIEEADGARRSNLTFRYSRESPDEPSVSLVYLGKPVCRVDVKPKEDLDQNPGWVEDLGLPDDVFGSHIHLWKHNECMCVMFCR